MTGFGILRRGARIVAGGVRARPRPFWTAVAGSLVFAAATVGAAVVLSRVVARQVAPALVTGRVGLSTVALAVGPVLGVAVVKAGGILVRRIAVGELQYGLVADSRLRLLHRFLREDLGRLTARSPGRLLAAVGSDAEAAWAAMGDLPLAVGAFALCVAAAAALWLTDPVLALVGTACFPVLVGVNVLFSRVVAPPLAAAQQARAGVSEVAAENVDGAQVIRSLGRAREERERFAAACDRLSELNVRAARVRALFVPLTESLPGLGTLALLLAGCLRMRSGALDLEQVLFAALLFSAIAFPLGGLGWMLNQLPRTVVGHTRLTELLDDGNGSPAVAAGCEDLPDGPLTVRLAGVGYVHEDGRPALTDVSLTVPAGRVVALTGPTGAGKSTLARLVAGLYRPASGRVSVSGVAPTALADRVRAREIGYVAQDTFLFDGTVRENLAPGGRDDEEELWRALRLAQADEFVARSDGGLDAPVGERGAALSGGQRQRIALARALVGRPRLLVLDDATSALDAETEAAVLASLATLSATVLVVAHRPATLAAAAEVVVLDRGRVTGAGPNGTLPSGPSRDARTAHGTRGTTA